MTSSASVLSQAGMSRLPAAVDRPRYDRSAIRAGIVHLGLTDLFRAHHAAYLDELMEDGLADDFGVVAVALTPAEEIVGRQLDRQDGLYTLVARHPDGGWSARVVGSVVAVLHARDCEAVLARMSDPATRIVSLTIGRAGYLTDPDTGGLDLQHPAVVHDREPDAVPASAIGLVVEALRRRRVAGADPFTVMSCDDIPGNGDVARRMVGALARLRDPELADWVEQHTRFPSSVIDRATGTVTADDRERLRGLLGVPDLAPVVTEPFTGWALEDDFCGPRPPYERAGVRMTDNVVPFAVLRLRLAGVGRLALGYLGYLAGYRRVHQVCADPLFTDFLDGYLRAEGIPTLLPVPGVDPLAYCRALLERLANPYVADEISGLCANGSETVPTLLVPVVEDNVRARRPVHHAALITAAWARYVEGTDEQGERIEVVDPLAEQLAEAASRQRQDALVLLRNPFLFGGLIDTPEFTGPYAEFIRSLHARGARGTLVELARTPGPSGERTG